MVNVTARVPEPEALVADTVTGVDPTTVGTPEITPVPEFRDRPAGKVPELMP